MTEYYDGDELVDTSAKLINEACGLEPERRSDHHHLFGGILARSSKDAFERAIDLGANSPFVFRQLAHALLQDGASSDTVKAVALRRPPPSS
jgi:hypothetical protein